MNNDVISDFLIRIKNAYLARHKTVEVPFARIVLGIGKILVAEGFIGAIKPTTKDGRKALFVDLSYIKRKPALTDLVRVSKPGLRVYVPRTKIPRVYGGIGTVILSTSKGLMSGKEALKQKLGGEIICKIW